MMKNLNLHFLILTLAAYVFSVLLFVKAVVRKKAFAKKAITVSLLLGMMFLGFVNKGIAQINISGGNTITQNFDGIGATGTATLPTGWKIDAQSTSRTLGTYAAAGSATAQTAGISMSTSATSGIYNFGGCGTTANATCTDRAVGGVSASSSNRSINVYVALANNGASAINSFTISYNVEKYRAGTLACAVQMFYSADGTTWTSAGSGFLTSFTADAAVAGFTSTPGATSAVTAQTLTTTVAATTGKLYLAWEYSAVTGTSGSNAQALGIDDVSITAVAAAVTTVPDPPTGVIATPGSSQASVAFTPPVNNGGASITSYTVTSSPGSFSTSGAGSPLVVTGLNNGTAYTFTATATNSVGPSSPSTASAPVTPVAAPTLSPSAATLSGITYIVGNGPSSPATSFTLTGSNLSPASGSIEIDAPNDYEVSTTSATSGFSNNFVTMNYSGGTVSGTVWVRLIAGLSVGSYNSESIAISGGGASSSVTANGTVTNPPSLTPSSSTLTGLTYVQGAGPSTASSFTLSGANLTSGGGTITINGSTDYEVSTTTSTTGFGASATLTYTGTGTFASNTVYVRLKAGLSTGTYNSETLNISGGGTTSSVTASGSVTAPPPVLTPSPTTITGLTYPVGFGPSTASSFTLSASNLTAGGGTITITGSADYEVSTTTSTTGFGASATLTYTGTGTFASNTVWVRLKSGLAVGSYNTESISISGGSGTSSITASGSVTTIQFLIAGWDFQTTTTGGSVAVAAPSFPTVFAANFGTGTMYLDGSNGSSSWITASGTTNEVTAFGGTTNVNVGPGFNTAAGLCLSPVGGGATQTANGKTIVFKCSMTGYKNLVVSYATQKTSTGFSTQKWEYSSNATAWTTFATITTLPTAFGADTLPTITTLENVPNAYIRLTLTGATAAAGNNRIDNVQLNGVGRIATSPSTLTGINYAVGSGPSAASSFTVSASNLFSSGGGGNITITPPVDYEVSVTSSSTGFSSSAVTMAYTGSGTIASNTVWVRLKAGLSVGDYNSEIIALSGGGTTGADTVSGTVNALTPTIDVTPATITNFGSVAAGGSSAEKTYSVSGTSIPVTGIIITAPADIAISTTSGSYTGGTGNTLTILPDGTGTIASTTIYVEYKPASGTGSYTGNITNASTGAVTKNVAVSGSAIATAPTVQRSITIGTITQNSIVLNFSNTDPGNGAKRIVLAKATAIAGGDAPVDGTTYSANAAFGSGDITTAGTYVVYTGTGNTVTVTGLSGGFTYSFAVYEYNDNNTAGSENYLTTAPGTNSATTTAATYTWTGATSTDWTVASNWSPSRSGTSTTDIIQFATVGGTVTNIPAQTIGKLLITNTTVNFQSTTTLTISGGSGALSVDAASAVNFNLGAFSIALATGSTGSISGAVTFSGGANKLTAADASGITFQSGSVFTTATGFTSTAFGSGTANSIVFASGATYSQGAGSSPFSLTQPASVVVFQHGSTYLLTVNSAPSFSGRTYGNFVYNAAATVSASGSAALTIDSISVLQGTFNIGMTGAFNSKGNISVASGAALVLNGTGTIAFNGTSTQTITGTVTVNTGEIISIANASGVKLGSSLTTKALSFTSGAIDLNGNTLTVNGGITGTGSFKGSAVSGLTLGATSGSSTIAFDQTSDGASNALSNLTVNGAGGTTVLSNKLNIYNDLNVAAGTLNLNAVSVVIKSTADATASVDEITGTLSGASNVTVERYIPENSQRAWRLLSVPTQTTQSINASWQEGNTLGVVGQTGIGTIITAGTANTGWATEGFDATQQSGSMLAYNQASNAWTEITSTYNNIVTTSGYFLYIRGDRTQGPASTTTSTTPTVLRTTGPLYQGTLTATSVPGGDYGLIGNTYASAIDFTGLTRDAGIDNKFYVWDPKLLDAPPSLGAYVTFSSVNNWVPVPGVAGTGSYGNAANTLIQSGQAFFVHATSTGGIALNEASKTPGSALVFRPAAPLTTSGRLTTNLFKGTNLADGNVAVFNSDYSNSIDGDDAMKLSNTVENFGLIRSNKVLVIEARQPVANTDTLYFDMWGMVKQQQYKLEFTPDNMNAATTTGYLEDMYLKTKTPVSLTSVTDIAFTVNSDAASAASNRFHVVLNESAPLPVTFTTISAQAQNSAVTVSWKVASAVGIKEYEVEYATDSISFTGIGTVAATGASNYSLANATEATGINYYRIKAIGDAGDITYSTIAKVTVGSSVSSGIVVYPNPVTGSSINILFNNLAKDVYTAKLLSIAGQEISVATISYSGTGAAGINIPSTLAAGTYKLEVSTDGGTVYTTSVIIK